VKLVLASANPDKAAEISAILAATLSDLELASRPAAVPDVDETGTTLVENARLKAAAVAAATAEAAVADDTGLLVDALDGAPGVWSARFAGEAATYADNVDKLLDQLRGVTGPARRARFRTVALAAWPDGHEISVDGQVEGTIAESPRGRGGFGYDSVFVPDEGDGRTFAELVDESPAAKHRLSHRGRAFAALAAKLTPP
jgi:XTP/dITP diphosphohydrolase